MAICLEVFQLFGKTSFQKQALHMALIYFGKLSKAFSNNSLFLNSSDGASFYS